MKNFLIILLGLFISITLVITLKGNDSDTQYFVDETKNEIEEMSIQKDSLFQLADNVLDIVVHKKEINDSIVNNLDYQVRNSEMTIEQQVLQLKELLKEAKESKEFALEQKDIAQKMEEMSIMQKMKAEKARMESEKQYQLLLEENKSLLEEIKNLKKLGDDKFNNMMISDTLMIDSKDIDIDIDSDKKKKRKKRKKN